MKQTHKIAYDFVQAVKTQRANEHMLHQAFVTLGSENQIFALAEPIEGALAALVAQTLGDKLFDDVVWWMYEADFGQAPTPFTINNQTYDPTQITLYKFLELADAN